MAGGKKGGDNSKKAQGQARKADAAAQKAAAESNKREAADAEDWQKGSKSNAKKEADAAKKAEQARKKAERDALLAEEERSQPARAAPKNAKAAAKKTSAAAPSRKLDLSQLDDGAGDKKQLTTLNATGIDNALDALSLDHEGPSGTNAIDRHPERRFKAAFAAFEERRLAEMDADGSSKGLRLNQRKDRIRKEFEKSPENPFNQVTGRYDSTRDELAQIHSQEKNKVEKRLGA